MSFIEISETIVIDDPHVYNTRDGIDYVYKYITNFMAENNIPTSKVKVLKDYENSKLIINDRYHIHDLKTFRTCLDYLCSI